MRKFGLHESLNSGNCLKTNIPANDSGRLSSYNNNFTDKMQNGSCKEAALFAISVLNWVFTSVIQCLRFTNDYKFGISVKYISVVDILDIPTYILLTILLFIDCSKMVQIRINTRNHTKEKPYPWQCLACLYIRIWLWALMFTVVFDLVCVVGFYKNTSKCFWNVLW